MSEPMKKKNKSWPVGLIIFYTCFVTVVVGSCIILGKKRFDLVTPDYYAEELVFQDRIDAVNRVQRLSQKPSIEVVDHASVQLAFPEGMATQVERGSVVLYRPSDARKDQQVDLELDGNGEQTVTLAETQRGLWSVKLSWVMEDGAYFMEQAIVLPDQLTLVAP